ncbi:MAG: TadE/TadG family type IV pilus assembly protein [Marmoricola sp.]
MSKRRRNDSGAAAVETALCLTFIVLPIVFAIISYAYMFSFRQALSQAADEGARAAVGATTGTACASTGPFTSACPAQYAAAQAVASDLAQYGMSCGTNNLTCTISAPTSCNSGANQCLSVQVGYPYRSHSLMPTIPGFGFTLPPDLSFTSSVTVS